MVKKNLFIMRLNGFKFLFLTLTLFSFINYENNYCLSVQEKSKSEIGWEQLPSILKKIKAPKFSNKEFLITQYGAVADQATNCKPAFDRAILDCSKVGGGKIIVPKGNYFVKGPIHLKSNVNLHLEKDAVIKFSTNPNDYLPVVFTRWEGIECYNYSSLIYAIGQENIAITGKGTFDAQANESNWWSWKGNKSYGWKDGMPSQSDSIGRPLLVKMNNQQKQVEERIFGKDHYLRPNFLQLINCKNVLIEGVTFLNSPMWVIHPVLCENVTIKNISTIGKGPNTDGCDPESCKNVLIKNCYFKNGDDCIAIKSGRNNDGRRLNIPSENIIIQNCKMSDGHGGVTIGSEISGGCRNVFAENCEMDSPDLDRAIRIKANTYRGGTVENIFVRNIKIGEVNDAVLHFDMQYEPAEGKSGAFIPVWRNINICKVTSKKSNQAIFFVGLNQSHIDNIRIENCRFEDTKKESTVIYVDRLVFKDTYINGKLLN